MKTLKLSIAPNGVLTTVYDDAHAALIAKAAKATITRASFVEPTPDGQWTADMAPVAPGVVLGPFRLRSEALAAEVQYLDSKLF